MDQSLLEGGESIRAVRHGLWGVHRSRRAIENRENGLVSQGSGGNPGHLSRPKQDDVRMEDRNRLFDETDRGLACGSALSVQSRRAPNSSRSADGSDE
jgi:hypothetical protein